MIVRLISISGVDRRALRASPAWNTSPTHSDSETILARTSCGQLIAVVQAIGRKRAPQSAVPVDRFGERTAFGAVLLRIDQRARDLAEQAVFRGARSLSNALRVLVGLDAS